MRGRRMGKRGRGRGRRGKKKRGGGGGEELKREEGKNRHACD
jgi:hypothetical protein